jgi:hypothetical protein
VYCFERRTIYYTGIPNGENIRLLQELSLSLERSFVVAPQMEGVVLCRCQCDEGEVNDVVR